MKKKEQDINECVVNEACLLSISKSRVIVNSEIERSEIVSRANSISECIAGFEYLLNKGVKKFK